MSKLRAALITIFCLSGSAHAGSFILNEYNVITIDNFTTNSHIDGRVFTGGDLIGSSKIGVGEHIDSAYSGVSLEVAGEINSPNGVSVHGKVEVYQGNGVSNTITNSGSQIYVNGDEIQNSNGVSVNTDLNATAAQYKAELESASAAFQAMEANSLETVTEGKRHTLTVDSSVGAGEYAVFELSDMNTFFTNTANQEAEIIANYTSINDLAGIIINVAGVAISQSSNAAMIGDIFGSFRDKILWNFYEATTISLTSKNFMGSLLAPLASVTANGDLDGAVGVFSLTTQNEVHLVNNTVTPSTSTPVVEVSEPATLVLFFIAVIALMRRRSF